MLAAQEAEYLAETAPPTRRGHLTAVPDHTGTHNPDAEAALLGAAILSASARDVLARIDPLDFHTVTHQRIAEALVELHAQGGHIDPVVICDHLDRQGRLDAIGGPLTIIKLQADTPSTTGAERYAAIVTHFANLRRLGSLGAEVALAATTPGADPAAVAADLQAALDAIHERTSAATNHLTELADALDEHLGVLEERQDLDLTGITTGIDALDAATGGLQDGRLYTIAGRPGMGKSDVAAHLARLAAKAGHRTLVISVEMPRGELVDRWLAAETRLPASRFTHGQLTERDWEHVVPAVGNLSELPIWIDDDPGSSMTTIRASLRRSGARLVIVDYLQILDGPTAETRNLQVTQLIRALKHVARDQEIPVVVLAQLNRGVEQRLDKRPMASDLRESGAIEQESDVVIGLYRDDFYRPDSDKKGMLEMILLKNRGGPTKTVTAAYFPDTKQILNLAGVN